MFIFICVTILLLYLLDWFLNGRERAKIFLKIPGPAGVFLIGNCIQLVANPVQLFLNLRTWSNAYKNVYRIWVFPYGVINIYNPDDIELILSNSKNNEKSLLYDFIRPWLKDGLLLSKGSKWQIRRKILTPAFHFNILRHFTTILEENSWKIIKKISNRNDNVTPFKIDVVPVMSDVTLNSICETAMGTKLDDKSGKGVAYKNAIHEMGKLIVYRIARSWLTLDFLFNLTKAGRKQKEVLKLIHNFPKSVIKERKEKYEFRMPLNDELDEDDTFMTLKRKMAMLDLLITAQKDGLISEDGIQEEVDTFMFEGHDTTAMGLCFILMELANNKEIQRKVKDELNLMFGDDLRTATMQELSQLKYLECCIKESLRLYPPVPFISRYITETVTLNGGYVIPSGYTLCHIHIFDLHRRADIFENPTEFKPERFLPENCIDLHPYAYIPFSAGPRNCIGQRFAMLEMKSVLSAILRTYELRPITTPADLEFSADLVLRTTHPIYVEFLRTSRRFPVRITGTGSKLICNFQSKRRQQGRHGILKTKAFKIQLNAGEAAVQLFGVGRKWANTYKDSYKFWTFNFGAINIYNPEDVETILSSTKYNEKSNIYNFLKPWLRDGLLLSNGSKWFHRRKILTPTFHFQILRHFWVLLEDNSRRLQQQLQKQINKSKTDIVPILSDYTLNSICETAMGTRLTDKMSVEGNQYKSCIHEMGNIVFLRVSRLLYKLDILLNLTNIGRRQNQLIKNIHAFTGNIINEREEYINKHGINIDEYFMEPEENQEHTKKKLAMLDLLIVAKKDGLIDHKGIQEEVDTFTFEGHDTTATALVYIMMLLANHKTIQDKVVEELREVLRNEDDTTRVLTMQDIGKLKYMECCIKESMRLYPPVHFIARELDQTVTLSNHVIPAGMSCNIHIFDLHRRADIFKEPLLFNPDRFLPENSVGRHPYAYIPFSAGPRNCIGQKFAMMEMKSAVAAVLRKLELLPVTRPMDLQLTSDLVLRNNNPVYVSFVERQQ